MVLDTHEAAAAHAHGVDLVAAFGDVNEHAGFKDLVIDPFAEVLLDDRREKFPEIAGTYIGNSILQGIGWIVRHIFNLLLPQVFLAIGFDVTCPSTLDFFFFPEDVRVGPGLVYHSGIRIELDDSQEFLHALALNQFSETLTVLAFFHPPIPDLFDQLFELVEGRLHRHKRNGKGGHLSAFENRSLGAEQDAMHRDLDRFSGPWA